MPVRLLTPVCVCWMDGGGRPTLEDSHGGREIIDSSGGLERSDDDGGGWDKVIGEGVV